MLWNPPRRAAAPHLLERDRELRRLELRLAAAREEAGGIVVVSGPAGSGKSSLLDRTAETAAADGMLALRAAGIEVELGFPFGVARQLVGSRRQPHSMASLRDLFDGPPTAEDQDLIHRLYWSCADLAERTPLLLVVDDVQWCDPASLRLLHYLAHRVTDLAILLVLGLRTGEPGGQQELISSLLTTRPVDLIELPPLSDGAIGTLVRDRLPDADLSFVDACVSASAGSPFLAQELVTMIVDERVPPTARSAPSVAVRAPGSVTRSVLGRLHRLSPAAVRIARAVAILEPDAGSHPTALLAELDGDTAAKAADELVSADLLLPDEPLRIRHPLVRAVIYADLAEAERSRWHGRAARLLDAPGVPAARLAAHLLLARPAGDPEVVAGLRRGATEALAVGAPGEAAGFLRRALAEPPPRAELADVLVELGRAEFAHGEPAADARLEAALGLVAEPRRRAEIRLERGRLASAAGHPIEAATHFRAGEEELASGGERTDPLAVELDAGYVSAARLEASLRPEAIARLERLLADPPEADTHASRVLLAQLAGESVFAGEPHEQGIALAERALAGGQLIREETSDGLSWISATGALGWADDLEGYDRSSRVAMDDARRRGSINGFADASYALSFSDHYRGRLADAVSDCEQALSAVADGWNRFLPAVQAQLAWALIELDDLAGAERTLAAAGDGPWAGSTMQALLLDASARLSLARGDPAAAYEAATAAGRIIVGARVPNPGCLPWRSNAALAAARLGEAERARDLIAEELELARRFGAARPIGVALRAHGLVVGGAAGIALLEESVTVLESSPAVLERVRAVVDLGAALRRSGRLKPAREVLRRGLDAATRSGLTRLERRAQSELAASGARSRRRVLTGWDALTPGERRAAEMAAAGLSNREIAEALFVTVKAVKWHLGNAYRKLGVERSGLARALEAAGQPDVERENE